MNQYCHYHITKKSTNKCHICNNYYCKLCLIKLSQYYYCKHPDCIKELEHKLISSDVTCPSCSSDLSLEFDERIEKKYHCPECEKYINLNFDPPKILDPLKYNYLLTTMNQTDVAILKTTFESEKLEYYIFGQNFLSLDPMIQGVKVYVYKKQFSKAVALVNKLDLHVFGGSIRTN